MAKNIDFMGATFPDVPSIRLPQHEGGLVSFTDVTDTTAVASDVANGKYFYTADGTKTAGTASGGITPSGTIQISQNGQVDVTNYATADVNVSGGGGGSSYTLITSAEFEVSSTSAQYGSVGTISIGTEYYQSEKILFVKIRDKAGARSGYYLGSDIIITNANAVNGTAYALGTSDISHRCYELTSLGYTETSSNNKGIYATKFVKNGGVLTLSYWKSSNAVIDGTFKVDIYTLDWPNNVSPFE